MTNNRISIIWEMDNYYKNKCIKAIKILDKLINVVINNFLNKTTNNLNIINNSITKTIFHS